MADQPKRTSTGNKSTAHLLNIKKPTEVKKRLKIAFQRVPAKMHLVRHQETLHISLALVDISDTGAGFFLSRMVSKGALVEFEITDPRPMKVKGLVAWCVPMNSGMHVLKHPFRAGIQFVFDSEEERARVAAFIQQLMTDDSVHWPTSAESSAAAPTMIPVETKEAAAPIAEAPAAPAAPAAEPVAAEDTEKKAA
ncbi:MAG: PilZ domain-containing protein [Bdellovibrionales bacterium]|nr:PilZ domain-containing protein [Bdellovibrionales bacterium]